MILRDIITHDPVMTDDITHDDMITCYVHSFAKMFKLMRFEDDPS
jgi:hypothetical protein